MKRPWLLALGLALAATAAWAASVSGPVGVTVVSHDGTVITAPSAAKITTAEGAWSFGTTANSSGDYPLLVNGSASGLAVSLQMTNRNLYAFAKSDADYWVRFNGAWIKVGSTAPVQGTEAIKVAVTPIPPSPKIPDNTPVGTVLANVAVTMAPASAPFSGVLVSSDPLYAFQGMNVILAQALTPSQDGVWHNATITAVQ
jgi:hypothetical protein